MLLVELSLVPLSIPLSILVGEDNGDEEVEVRERLRY